MLVSTVRNSKQSGCKRRDTESMTDFQKQHRTHRCKRDRTSPNLNKNAQLTKPRTKNNEKLKRSVNHHETTPLHDRIKRKSNTHYYSNSHMNRTLSKQGTGRTNSNRHTNTTEKPQNSLQRTITTHNNAILRIHQTLTPTVNKNTDTNYRTTAHIQTDQETSQNTKCTITSLPERGSRGCLRERERELRGRFSKREIKYPNPHLKIS